MSTLVDLWNRTEQRQPHKLAVITDREHLTYRQLGQRIRRLSSALALRGRVSPGDVVALLAPNCAEFVISYFAVVTLGATVQPVDERLTLEEIRTILLDASPKVLIVHHSLWSKLEQIQEVVAQSSRILGIGVAADGVEDFAQWITTQADLEFISRIGPATVAELMYTSGTTGKPKGVMRSHTNVRAASRNSVRGFGYREGDVIAIVMPLSHSSALNSQMMPLVELGGTLVLLDRFDVDALLHAIKQEQVTCMRAVPAMIHMLLASSTFCSHNLPSLRAIINSSGPIDPKTFTEVKHRFASVEVMNSYGLTEASTCTILPDAMALLRPDSIGHPIAGVEMGVMDEEGRVLPGEAEGEICVRGEHVFVGYRNRPQAYQAAFAGGWLRTRDLAFRDKDGYYYLLGRTDDVINCGGHKFAPFEVENCILQLPEVAEVAVVGAAHPVLGEVGKAYVVPSQNGHLNVKHIIHHCTRSLPSYKIPFFVEVTTRLPKNSLGKVLYRQLKENSQ